MNENRQHELDYSKVIGTLQQLAIDAASRVKLDHQAVPQVNQIRETAAPPGRLYYWFCRGQR